jgi:[ribosomal protein S5]-alanine N-acetyltransferase
LIFSQTGRSERLVFEKLVPAHAVELASALTDPRVNAYFGSDWPNSLADVERHFARVSEGAGNRRPAQIWINHAVRLGQGGVHIGRIEATIQRDFAEVAYVFGKDFWGQGYATEATRWLQADCVARHNVKRFWATVSPQNQLSVRVLSRLGYVRSPKSEWPMLLSYDEGDLVYRLRI